MAAISGKDSPTFCPLNGHCSMAAISGKDSPTHAASNSRSPFPIYALKSCPAPAALAAGAGHYFSLTAYNLTFKPPYRGKGLKKDIS